MASLISDQQIINHSIDTFVEYISSKRANKDKVINALTTFCKTEDLTKAYPEISKKIYTLSPTSFTNLEKFMGIATGSKSNKSHFDSLSQGIKDFVDISKTDNLRRLERHIKLSCYQREYINRTAQSANDAAEKAVKNSKMAQKKVKSIYSEFVGILGIFTAMSFAMMGSVEILGNLFSDLKNLSSASLGYAFIVGGVYLIVIYLIILMLFIGIKKLFADGEYQIDFKFCLLLLTVSIIFFTVGIVLLNPLHLT